MNKYYTLTLLAAFSFTVATAQYNRHIVEFTDKKGTQFALANPAAYLSAKAIERRTKQNIAIDSTDLPVSKEYLDSIASVPNVTILNRSKWLNQVLIRTTDPNAITKINSFPFVKKRTAIAPRANPADFLTGGKPKNKFDETETPVNAARQEGTDEVQLDYGSTGNQIRIHKGDFLHNLGFTGQNITMSILDAGFLNYKTNPALDSVRLQGRVLGEWDYVANHASVNEDNSHGANCFTIIASNRPGSIVGSAPHSRFWVFRTEDAGSEYPVEEQNWVAAAEFSDSAGVDMISSSLGYADFDDPSFDHTYAQRDGNTSIVTRGADLAARKGIIVMNSAGNSGNTNSDLKFVACPADGDSVVAVGAIDINGNIAGFSSWGPNGAGKLKPNIVSVGVATVYASSAGNPVAGNGTSYSNPNIAGLIACFWQAFPELNNMQVIDAVQKSAHKYTNPDARYGYGIPDFRKAFMMMLKDKAQVNATLNTCAVNLTWESKDNSSMQYRVQRKLPQDADFITLATISGKSAAFQRNNYTYVDSLKNYTGMAQYVVQQVVTADTTLLLGALQVNVTSPCITSTAADGIFISVTPNPIRNNIARIRISTSESLPNLNMVITTMSGQIIRSQRISAPLGVSVQQVALGHVAAGVYAVKVYNGNQEIFVGQVIKR